MIDQIFEACVWLLAALAARLGITYQAINVWIFVILWPIVTLGLIAIVLVQHRRLRALGRRGP